MGTSSSKTLEEMTKEEIATCVADHGERYQIYSGRLIGNGIDGNLLDSLDEQAVEETLDDLEISNRLHRRVLLMLHKKAKQSSRGCIEPTQLSTLSPNTCDKCWCLNEEKSVSGLNWVIKKELKSSQDTKNYKDQTLVKMNLEKAHALTIRSNFGHPHDDGMYSPIDEEEPIGPDEAYDLEDHVDPEDTASRAIQRRQAIDTVSLEEYQTPRKDQMVLAAVQKNPDFQQKVKERMRRENPFEHTTPNLEVAAPEKKASHKLPIFQELMDNEEDRAHLPTNFYDMVDALQAPRPPIAKNDMERSAVVEALCLTDILPTDTIASHLESMVKMATEVFDFPYGEITFQNHEFQFRIASYSGGENPFSALNTVYQSIACKADGERFLCKTGRGASICNYTVAAGQTFVIKDVAMDETFVWLNALIPVRCYAGSPIKDSAGRIIANLCLFDTRPRPDFEAAHEIQIEQFATMIAQSIESWAIARAVERLELERSLIVQGCDKTGPPKGNVTFVLTDIQGSTALWESDPAAMQDAIDLHDSIMRRHCAIHWGFEIETEGDSFTLAFHDPVDAVAFALDVQAALVKADWSEEILRQPHSKEEQGAFRGLRVRTAIHQGCVGTDVASGRTSFVGETLKLTKNLASMTHGGQILTTAETWEVASYFMGKKLGYPQVVDLGSHVLQKGKTMKDGLIVKRIIQLLPCELAVDYFAGRKLLPPTSNDQLTVSTTQGIGRRFPPFASFKQISASFHDAPYENNEITVAFVNMSLVDDRHVAMLENVIGTLLDGCKGFNGYHCHKEMLVFRRPLDALLFGLLLQRELHYRGSLEDGTNLGQIIKYGCIHGNFLTMGPHRKTGRADYFGQIVNRAARLSSAAAAGSVCLGVVCCSSSKDNNNNNNDGNICVVPVQHTSMESRFCGRKLLRGIQKEIDVFEFTYARTLQMTYGMVAA